MNKSKLTTSQGRKRNMLTCHEICGMTRTNAFARCCVCFDGVEGKRSPYS